MKGSQEVSKSRECYISAPAGADLHALREALARLNVEWIDQSTIDVSGAATHLLIDALSGVSFMCAVLPYRHDLTSVAYEIGIATAVRTPIMLFIDPRIKVPPRFQHLPYARLQIADSDALQFHLETFVGHILAAKILDHSPPATKALQPSQQFIANALKNLRREREDDFESAVAALFEAAGAVVSKAQRPQKGVDLSVWMDGLPSSLGNVLLVEVKTGELSQSSLDRAEKQLRTTLNKVGAPVGVIIYRDAKGTQYPESRGTWPLVWRVDFERFVHLLAHGELEKALVAFRNRAVHG